MTNDICAALAISGTAALIAWAIWLHKPLRGRHRERTLIARTLEDLAADAWIQAWRPSCGDRLAVLRMRREMRRWIPRRRLP